MKPCQSTMAWKNPSLSKILFVLIVSTSNKVNGRCQKEGACPADWSKWGNNCYHFVENGLYWAQAQQHCVDIGGVLTAPHSREEEDYLLAWTNAGQLWINCNDISSEGMSLDRLYVLFWGFYLLCKRLWKSRAYFEQGPVKVPRFVFFKAMHVGTKW